MSNEEDIENLTPGRVQDREIVRNKIKHRKKYKIGKSPTPLGKITIVL
jgi:hypothetical protein